MTNCPRQWKTFEYDKYCIKKRVWGESSQEAEDKQEKDGFFYKEKQETKGKYEVMTENQFQFHPEQ